MDFTDRIAEVSARLQGLAGFPCLEDSAVCLRPPRDDDAGPLFALFSEPRVMRYWSRPPMRARVEAERHLGALRDGFARREGLGWILCVPGEPDLLGTCSLYDLQLRHLRCGIGYALLPSAQGRGLATAAVQLACAWVFDWLGLHRVEADVHPDNHASRRVLERAGFRCEGVLRQRFVTASEIQDSAVYARLAGDAPAAVE